MTGATQVAHGTERVNPARILILAKAQKKRPPRNKGALQYIFTLDLIVDTVNVTFKITAFSAFIITEMALVRLDLIVYTVNVNL